jgi:anti-anti-sigma factor
VNEENFKLTPEEQDLLTELGQKLRRHLPDLTAQWESAWEDLLADEEMAVPQPLRHKVLSSGQDLVQVMVRGWEEDQWQQVCAYGEDWARRGLAHSTLGRWLSSLRLSLLSTLTQAYADNPRIDQALICFSKIFAFYMLGVTERFSGWQQQLLLKEQQGLRRAYEKAQRRMTEMEVLNRIGQAMGSTMEPTDLLELILQQATLLMDTDNFYIALYDEALEEWNVVLNQEHGQRRPPTRQDAGAGLTGHIIGSRQPILLRNSREYVAFHEQHGIDFLGEKAESWMGVPLIVSDRVVGVIAVQSYTQEGAYTEEDLDPLRTIASQAAIALQNAWLYEDSQQRVAELSALQRVGLELAATTELSEVLDTVADSAMDLLHPNTVLIFLYDSLYQTFTLGTGLRSTGERGFFVSMPRPDGLTGTVASTGKLITVEDATSQLLYNQDPEFERQARSVAGVPLIRSGRILGVLNVIYHEPHRFEEEEIRLLRMFADQAAVAVANANLFQQTNAMMRELQETADAQSQLLQLVQELSTPVVPLVQGVLVMPLVGSIDSRRGQQILERLLQVVERERARIVLVDITGVPVVDSAVAEILLQATQAVRLLGGEAVLVGITPEVAQTLVSLGVDLTEVITRSDLQGGVTYATQKVSRMGRRSARLSPEIQRPGS